MVPALNGIAFKQQFNKIINGKSQKQIELKNRTYYFYNGIISIEEFNSSLLKTDNTSYKDIDIYYEIGDCENIYSVNPLYLIIDFNTGNNLSLNKPLKLDLLIIMVRCIFEEDGKYYPQLY